MSDFYLCFADYLIAHARDSSGYVRTWYDNDNDDDYGTAKTFTFSPGQINDTVYISVENYPFGVVPTSCFWPKGSTVTLLVRQNS